MTNKFIYFLIFVSVVALFYGQPLYEILKLTVTKIRSKK